MKLQNQKQIQINTLQGHESTHLLVTPIGRRGQLIVNENI